MDIKSPWFLDWLLILLMFCQMQNGDCFGACESYAYMEGKGAKRDTIPLPYGVKIPAFLYAVISMDRANTVLLGSSSIIRNKNCKMLRHVQNMMIAAGNVPMSSRMFSFLVSTDPWIEIRTLFMMILAIS